MLHLKYRPSEFDSVIGNEEITGVLRNMIQKKETCPHSFLLHGPTGCGKTTIGRIMAVELGATGDDFKEIDSGDFRGIDTVREIRKNARFKPIQSTCRVFLIDECHKMTNDAQNALLKILEDTPNHVYFILCTTDPQKLIAAVKNRCSQFAVKTLSERQMMDLLRSVVKEEEEMLPKIVYSQIIEDSQGHPRMALTILEQVLNAPTETRLETAKQSAAEQSESIALCRSLMQPNTSWSKINTILRGLKDQEPEGIRRHVMGYAQSVLLKNDNELAGLILEEFREPFYQGGFPLLVLACYSVIKS